MKNTRKLDTAVILGSTLVGCTVMGGIKVASVLLKTVVTIIITL